VGGVVGTVRLTTSGELSTRAVVEESLARIAELDRRFDAFTVVLADPADRDPGRLRRRRDGDRRQALRVGDGVARRSAAR
jgi:hypothetical protein